MGSFTFLVFFYFEVSTVTFSDANNSDDSDLDDSYNVVHNSPEKTRNKRLKKKMIFTPRMIAALDKCQVSNRQAMHIISSIVIALGHSIDEIVLNRTSLIKYRKENQKQIAEEVQNNYNVIYYIMMQFIMIYS